MFLPHAMQEAQGRRTQDQASRRKRCQGASGFRAGSASGPSSAAWGGDCTHLSWCGRTSLDSGRRVWCRAWPIQGTGPTGPVVVVSMVVALTACAEGCAWICGWLEATSWLAGPPGTTQLTGTEWNLNSGCQPLEILPMPCPSPSWATA